MNAEIRSSRPPLLPAGWALTRFGLWLLAVSCPILLALGSSLSSPPKKFSKPQSNSWINIVLP